MHTQLRDLRALPAEPLTPAEVMDRLLAEGFLEIALWEATSRHFEQGNPSLYTGEAIFGVLSLFLRPFAPLAERVESAIARLHAIPTLLRQAETNVRSTPAAWTARALRECRGALAFLGDGVDILIAEYHLDGSTPAPCRGRGCCGLYRLSRLPGNRVASAPLGHLCLWC